MREESAAAASTAAGATTTGRSAAAASASTTAASASMRRWLTIMVTVEGPADARGTNEYTRALGARRAAAVKDYLVSLGIAGDRILAISKGEEEPLCREMTEACYTMNRRGHFIITAK